MTSVGQRPVALACETVELVQERGVFPIKVSVVDEQGTLIYDRLVIPTDAIVDFRTWYHGITPEMVVERGLPFTVARTDVNTILKNKIVVGYDLNSSLKTMLLDDQIPKPLWKDTAYARLFRKEKIIDGDLVYAKLSLQELAQKHLKLKMNEGLHDAAEDAKVAMMLYRKFKDRSDYDWYGNFR